MRIGVAVIRLPEFRDAYDAAQRRGALVEPAAVRTSGDANVPAGVSKFEIEQLPALLQAISDINHRQIAAVNGHENLVRSVPVTLRKLTREVNALRSQHESFAGQVADQAKQLEDLAGRVDGQLGDLAQRVAEVASEATAAAARAGNAENGLGGLAESVSYLLGRVEFVRREVMFEMRYGASKAGNERDALTPQVVATEQGRGGAARRVALESRLWPCAARGLRQHRPARAPWRRCGRRYPQLAVRAR